MSNSTTVARPYAKAIFEYALAEKKLVDWSEYLHILSQAVLDSTVHEFITNPQSEVEQQIDLLHSLCNSHGKDKDALHNMIALVASNKRLLVLPEIKDLYEVHKAEQEKTLDVDVVSFSKLTDLQQKNMIEALSERTKRKVSLNISIDPSLLGGAIIRAGDLVIDGSVRGKLNKLSSELAA